MPHPRLIPLLILSLTACAPTVRGADNPADAEAVTWLKKLETRGAQLKSLEANLVYKKRNTISEELQTRTGRVYFAAADEQNDKPPRFAVSFEHLIVDAAARPHQIDFVFDGTWLVERNHATKQFFKRQVVPPGQKIDPLRLDGPFPLPMGQKHQAVLARFDVEIIPPEGEAAKGPVLPPLHLKLTPKKDAPQIQGQKQFDRVELWYDRRTLLPVKVLTVEGASETEVKLKNVQADTLNEAALEKHLDVTPPGEGWRTQIEPWKK